jgi:hypothetical protein
MSKPVTVFLVGNASSPKTNQWLSMTDCRHTAQVAYDAIGEGATFKEVKVSKPRRK